MIYTGHMVMLGYRNIGSYNGLGMGLVWGRIYTVFWWRNLLENGHLEDSEDGRMTL